MAVYGWSLRVGHLFHQVRPQDKLLSTNNPMDVPNIPFPGFGPGKLITKFTHFFDPNVAVGAEGC